MGSLEQLENTEKSNGIVQDEPEIVMQSTEKIEVLFNRIRGATVDEAEVYGMVLAQVLKDLLPPNEVLTKIIKELLMMNQSNTIVISKIVHQVIFHNFLILFKILLNFFFRYFVQRLIHPIWHFFKNG
jgi:huntingtin